MAHILLVDDDTAFTKATADVLSMLGHTLVTANSVEDAMQAARQSTFTHVILDLILPDGSGLHVLDALRNVPNDLKIALVTGHDSIKSLIKNFYGPNICYFLKPIDLETLKNFLREDRHPTTKLPNSKLHFGYLIGESQQMKDLYEMIERVSQTAANVLLVGESGAGKEEVAAAIHHASAPDGNFIPVNCGALSPELINSELFGHEKGAFTGAVARKPGVFEVADKGTLFLDEITEMPLDMQPNLLRVLETSRVTRLGATQSLAFSCRVISATNRSEAEIVEQHKLREDLYFRLAVFPIYVPPLRSRKTDIPLLVEHFLQQLNKQYSSDIAITEQDLRRLSQYDWPGNVRELKHCLHRAFIMADQERSVVRLPEQFASPFSRQGDGRKNGIEFGKTVEDVERELIETTLTHLSGDKKQAAEMLGISLKTLYNRLNKYESMQE